MAGNSFGQIFRIATCGESHGGEVAVIVDGCPPNLELNELDIQLQLDRRKPAQSHITTPRKEQDIIHIMSGVFNGKTTGTPILLSAKNMDAQSSDYLHLRDVFRPSHADYTYLQKYGIRDYNGSGRASARETLSRVAAGAIALKYLRQIGVEIISYVEQVGHIKALINHEDVLSIHVEDNIIRCPDSIVASQMIAYIKELSSAGNSIGGIIKTVIRGVPVGLGEPVFDKLHADLAKAMLSINAAKGFDIGSGFDGVVNTGSQNNDSMRIDNGGVKFVSNNSGGVLGGISNGSDIYFRTAFKAVSTIGINQSTVDKNGNEVELQAHGRHDPCVLPRAVPIVDAMSALVIMDHYLRNKLYW